MTEQHAWTRISKDPATAIQILRTAEAINGAEFDVMRLYPWGDNQEKRLTGYAMAHLGLLKRRLAGRPESEWMKRVHSTNPDLVFYSRNPDASEAAIARLNDLYRNT
ncbi:MAG: hypothetical protein AUG51_01730 [Acidobacteria bacterium 13_1_20CM_3_53_8]|nr:MAG: hypothetical protein AUG51_01730 [Acidobacteria bacterium 13_1_20CM_3_53_8]